MSKNTQNNQPMQVKQAEPVSKATDADTVGNFIDKKCPKCGASLLGNKIGDEWCSNVSCDFGVGDSVKETIKRTTSLDQVIEQARAHKTTIAISGENRTRLDALQKDLSQPDVNGVITVLLESYPGKQSKGDTVTLEMSRHKFDWLMAGQRNSDCSDHLKASVR
jgi:hypothetical protein